MRIKYKSKFYKLKERIKEHKEWHKKFIIWPRKIELSENDIDYKEFHFMCYIGRRLNDKYRSYSYNYSDIKKPNKRHYQYKTLQNIITDKLMGKQDED